ncbi:MAG: hypothetical protein A7316_01245 [Candidatus Altiarchaeales archaeon WOR_SM1_86-2]|nr:MAG: hypothetical protein A7316_01245 [Candidatus Altiarchaeales archaeon WOR_SM1_86-2]
MNVIGSSIMDAMGDNFNPVILLIVIAILLVIMGAVAGAALGLALRDIRKVLYLACSGAVGNIIAGIVVIVIGIVIAIISAIVIGPAAVDEMAEPRGISILGAMFGAVLESTGGIIFGTVVGLTLAYLIKKDEEAKIPEVK